MNIIVDTREKNPFLFSIYNINIIKKKLNTGDYSLNVEGSPILDRKASISELYTNFFKKYNTFKKELIRSQIFRAFYFICEFPYSHVLNFPANMPRGNYRFNAGHIIDKIKHIEEKYGAKFIFCENREHAEETCFNILKDYYEKHNE